jgi:signal transduction histidine kinase
VALTDIEQYRVGLIWITEAPREGSPEPAITSLTSAGLSLVAVVTPNALRRRSLAALVARHFYDYLTLPVDAESLRLTLGHAHGMACLRAQAHREPRDDLQRRCHEQRRPIGAVELAKAAERSRIARDLHDDLAQSLSALRLGLAQLGGGEGAFNAPGQRQIPALITLVDDSLEAMRRTVSNLRPAGLDALGLSAACEGLVREFALRTGINCDWDLDHSASQADAESALTVFRILQEALTNVARHSAATAVRVHLAKRQDDLVVEVRDDGNGFEYRTGRHCDGFGLLSMDERAASQGGVLTIDSVRGAGTRIVARIPMRRARAAAASTAIGPERHGFSRNQGAAGAASSACEGHGRRNDPRLRTNQVVPGQAIPAPRLRGG